MAKELDFSQWEFHKFEMEGKYMLYDVNSAQYFSIDCVLYKVLDYIKTHKRSEIINMFSNEYPKDEIVDIFNELETYQKKGLIFLRKRILPPIKNMALSPLSELTINVANDCNLRCKYCWNHYGSYGDNPHYMDKDTAIKSIDFLFRMSQDNKNLSIDFYGGESLLNFDVLKICVEYGLEKARQEKKEINFRIETNGTLLNDEIIDYLEKRDFHISISIDGRKDYHDMSRKDKYGQGTWDRVISMAQKILEKKIKLGIRATLMPSNTELLGTVKYLNEIGFKDVQVEYALDPCVGRRSKEKFINNNQKQLMQLAKEYLASASKKSPQDWLTKRIWYVYDNTPRIYGCSVRYGNQVAIDAKGDIYPCVVFTGQKEYILGNVAKEDLRLDIFKIFHQNRIDKVKDCKDCWARFLCGGGCIGLNGWYVNDISVPDMTLCNEKKDTFKILMWLISELQEKAPDFFDKSFNLQGEKSAVITVSNNQRISEGIQKE